MKGSNSNDNPWRAMFVVSAAGAELAGCVTAGFYLGRYVGRLTGFETAGLIVGVLAGLAAGGIGIYYLIRYVTEDKHG